MNAYGRLPRVLTLPGMPELPEVETTRRGLAPHVEGRIVTDVVLRRPDLRWPIPPEIPA
jgi:formamidopyrimidine-DNA glycosylase